MKVGFFDSGIGGTCILNAFKTICPDVETEYIADTEHCPYGNRPPDEIIRLSEANVRKLLSREHRSGTSDWRNCSRQRTKATFSSRRKLI